MVEKNNNNGKVIRRHKSEGQAKASYKEKPFYKKQDKKQNEPRFTQVSQERLQELADHFNNFRH